ncbi:TetR/AcrR family transcriptional regulator, partial [Staphylococcus epidermidis]
AYKQLRSGAVPAISVTDIIRDTGLSTRAFYNLFDSKDALVLALCRREFIKMTTRLAVAVAAADGPAAALRAWIAEGLQAGYDPRRATRSLVFHSVDARIASGFRQVNKEGLAAQHEILATVLRDGREAGVFPLAEPELDAQAIQAVV